MLFALGGMVLNSVAGLLQADATQRVKRQRQLLTQPHYVIGLLVDGLAWVCTVVALRHLPVFAVQGILGGSIALTAVAARIRYGWALRQVDRLAIGACLVGLVRVAGSAGGDRPATATATAYGVLFGAAVLLAVAMVLLWRDRGAWPLSIIAGLGFGGTSLAVRAVHVQPGRAFGLVDLLSQPAFYLVLVLWAIGMLSYTRALRLGSLDRVTAVFQVTEVIVPGLVGIVLLDDTVRAGWQFPMAVGLVLAALGVLVLARSPARPPLEPAPVP
jgi:drug/metabolite transporter (DMT)-like permease